ncbi:hypothetical protein Hanom_Chr04g00293801 [Helianthus anomalus]
MPRLCSGFLLIFGYLMVLHFGEYWVHKRSQTNCLMICLLIFSLFGLLIVDMLNLYGDNGWTRYVGRANGQILLPK